MDQDMWFVKELRGRKRTLSEDDIRVCTLLSIHCLALSSPSVPSGINYTYTRYLP